MSDFVITEVANVGKDEHGNWSYWVRCQGVEMGVAVTHKADKPVMKDGETLQQHGFTWLEEKTSARGNKYFKARRPEKSGYSGNGGGGDDGTRDSIERQVAAKEASNLIRIAVEAGIYKPEDLSGLGMDHRALTNGIAKTIAGDPGV